MSSGYFIDGLPIDTKYKRWLSPSLLLAAIVNHTMWVLNSVFDYAQKDNVTLILMALAVLLSFGSKFAESVIIAVAAFEILSLWHDFGVFDISLFRIKLFYGSIVLLIIASVFGKISVLNIFREQLGLR